MEGASLDPTMAFVEGSDVGETIGTHATLASGESATGSISTATDEDMYAIQVTAGTSYTISMNGTGGLDTVLYLLNSGGSLITSNDDISSSNFNSQIVWTATYSGTAYILADGYEDTTGSSTGAYTIAVAIGGGGGGGGWEAPNLPAPLSAIDWGYTVPDHTPSTPVTDINVYFVPGGMTFNDGESHATTAWGSAEYNAALNAFAAYEAICNVDFHVVTNPALADFFMVETSGNDPLGYWNIAGGNFTLNGTSYNLDGAGVFFNGGKGWNTTGGLDVGGYGYITLIHELGHGMGLAHPHDNGGTSSVMTGVTGPFGSYGAYGLNQGIWTMMSYNDGWHSENTPPSNNYGWEGTPMALDIAVLQDIYGAVAHNSGNNTYTLPSSNGLDPYYQAIWDTGGIDAIVNNSGTGAIIDLKPATLQNAVGGGGYVSYVSGILGGFTIAAGVVIENAVGGNGADTIYGNGANNVIFGNGGVDAMNGAAGSDWLYGGTQSDTSTGGAGADWFVYSGAISNAGDVITDYAEEDVVYFGAWSGNLSIVDGASTFTVNGVQMNNPTGNITVITQGTSAHVNATAGQLDFLLAAGVGALKGEIKYIFDADNNESFSSKEFYYDNADKLNLDKTFFDSGSTYLLLVDYDQNNDQTWIKYKNYYSSAGVIDFKWTFYDAGQPAWAVMTNYDQSNAGTWSFQSFSFKAPDSLDFKWIQYDAGQPLWGIKTDYDQAHAGTWDYISYAFSAQNVLDYKWIIHDAGQSIWATKTDYDQAHAASWDSIVYAYSAQNVLDYKWVFYDAGSSYYAVKTDYDQANQFAWDQHIIVYDTPGHVFNEYYV